MMASPKPVMTSPKADRVKEMAQFVVHLGFTPDQYWALTGFQRDAIIAEWNRSHKK